MIDHFGIGVRDFDRAQAFYEKVLTPLGFGTVHIVPPELTGGERVAGFGDDSACGFWINQNDDPAPALHFAFRAKTREQVDAFYVAALAAGARGNGAPGLRSHYHPNYYGAFVFDLEGNNIEAVCHAPKT